MASYPLSLECIARDCAETGKAWAGLRDGIVVAVRFMNAAPALQTPAWAKMVLKNADAIDGLGLPIVTKTETVALIEREVQNYSEFPAKLTPGRFRGHEVVDMARAVLMALEKAAFDLWRKRCRAELTAEGARIVTGHVVGAEFVELY